MPSMRIFFARFARANVRPPVPHPASKMDSPSAHPQKLRNGSANQPAIFAEFRESISDGFSVWEAFNCDLRLKTIPHARRTPRLQHRIFLCCGGGLACVCGITTFQLSPRARDARLADSLKKQAPLARVPAIARGAGWLIRKCRPCCNSNFTSGYFWSLHVL